jgi:hypothetical protein
MPRTCTCKALVFCTCVTSQAQLLALNAVPSSPSSQGLPQLQQQQQEPVRPIEDLVEPSNGEEQAIEQQLYELQHQQLLLQQQQLTLQTQLLHQKHRENLQKRGIHADGPIERLQQQPTPQPSQQGRQSAG